MSNPLKCKTCGELGDVIKAEVYCEACEQSWIIEDELISAEPLSELLQAIRGRAFSAGVIVGGSYYEGIKDAVEVIQAFLAGDPKPSKELLKNITTF